MRQQLPADAIVVAVPGAGAGPPRWLVRWHRWTTHLSRDLGGGPRPLRLAWVINLQKGATAIFVAALMLHYGNFSTAAWVYLALHGGYGLCWVLKDLVFPDPAWRARVTWGGAAASVLLVLGPYWVLPWLLISGRGGAVHPPALLAAAITLTLLGLALMLGADAQKFFTLRHRSGLITEGFFSRVRHPNYLGEMLIYGSFALLVGHWLAWGIVTAVWLGVFLPNMAMKEASLARHPGWWDYRQRTGWLLPRLRVPED